jgi:hypothetical protein
MISSRRRTLPVTSASLIASIVASCSRIDSPASRPAGRRNCDVRVLAVAMFSRIFCCVFVPNPGSFATRPSSAAASSSSRLETPRVE